MSHPVNASTKHTSKKFKAILAGGVVLGVGAAVTLAAWTDQEWASANFNAGSFTLQSSTTTDGTGFKKHGKGTEAPLEFGMQASELGPGETVAAPFSLRLDEKTTHGAAVNLASTKVTGDATGLEYSAFIVPLAQDCTYVAESATPLISGSLTTGDIEHDPFHLSPGADKEPGTPVTVCFQITADDNLPEDQETSATWKFDAESIAN